MNIKTVAVLENPRIQGIQDHKRRVIAFLRSRGLRVAAGVSEDADLLVTMGGDGTLLKGVHALKNERTPVYGMKFGNVGFLTNTVDDPRVSLRKALEGGTVVSPRMLLDVEVFDGRRVVFRDVCLNDAVISRRGIRILGICGRRDGKPFLSLRCDALVIATPTGSTAHALACGGPILPPEAEGIVVVPACPYGLSSAPVVFPSRVLLEMRVEEAALLVADGQREEPLEPGWTVRIRRSGRSVRLLLDRERDFFSTLHEKFGWTLQNRRPASAGRGAPRKPRRTGKREKKGRT